ncbi:MAG: glycosylase [bacterium]
MIFFSCTSTRNSTAVSEKKMLDIYEKIKTPYKHGVVFKHPDSTKLIDSPSIFRWKKKWWMTYIIFDGRGYETWLAESDNLVDWTSKGRIMSFSDTGWDANQKAGYMSLLDINWGGSYKPTQHEGKYWMSYLGGSVQGYEAGRLGVGIANTENPAETKEWQRLSNPVLAANDPGARWFENSTIYKSYVIHDKKKHTGKPFVMFYNAAGDTAKYESIGMAVSDNMTDWKRFGNNPLITRYKQGTICGDAQITKMGKLYVMFYFGAFWNGDPGAYERFACSYDLINWTDWQGEDLIKPSESYDNTYAHKPFVIKWKGKVYHFYNAVGDQGRVIALATSSPID